MKCDVCTSHEYHHDINSGNLMNYVAKQLITNVPDYNKVH